MSGADNMLLESFRRLLASLALPAAVRSAERDGDVPSALWAEIEASGFADALVPEAQGGAGLSLADIFPLIAAAGEFLLPVPFADTMIARALLARAGVVPPAGKSILLIPLTAGARGRPYTQALPQSAAADFALIAQEKGLALLPMDATGAPNDPFRTGGGVRNLNAAPVLTVSCDVPDLLSAAAAVAAASMSGAMARVLALSLDYVQSRKQFGRPLSKYQVLQHQISVMAEHVVATHLAARMGLANSGPHELCFDPLRAAAAKLYANEAAHRVCAIAHALHGAIGISEEYDLQLYTRRIKQWQLAFGSESFWAARLGAARLQEGSEGTSVDFVRGKLQE